MGLPVAQLVPQGSTQLQFCCVEVADGGMTFDGSLRVAVPQDGVYSVRWQTDLSWTDVPILPGTGPLGGIGATVFNSAGAELRTLECVVSIDIMQVLPYSGFSGAWMTFSYVQLSCPLRAGEQVGVTIGNTSATTMAANRKTLEVAYRGVYADRFWCGSGSG
jgi:hypothetical protein